MDEKLKRQLIAARENIGAQLEQLEGTSRGMGDCRSVYADLQRELQEIDTLLAADGTDVETKSDYQPAIKWYDDGTVGNPVRPSLAGRLIGVITVGSLVVSFAIALLRACSE